MLTELAIAGENQRRPRAVILAERDKVEMEDAIRERLGRNGRLRVVCRSGSPISLDDLAIANPQAALAATHEALDGAHELSGALLLLLRWSADHAVTRMVLEEPDGDGVEGGLGGRYLGKDVRTPPVFFDHALDASHLALDAPQPLEQGVLLLGVPTRGARVSGHARNHTREGCDRPDLGACRPGRR